MKKLICTIITLFSLTLTAQYSDGDSNHIGIMGGINQFSLNTDDFNTSPEMGWNVGLSVRGGFYNNFDMVYGIQFSENNFSVETTNALLQAEDVKYKLSSAQISLLLSYKPLGNNHLSFEFGPMVQVNGKLAIEESDEMNIINGTTMLADDITDISKFNFYPTVGVTAGVTHFRVNVMYQYGVNNILGKVDGDLKGNAGILSGNIILYL